MFVQRKTFLAGLAATFAIAALTGSAHALSAGGNGNGNGGNGNGGGGGGAIFNPLVMTHAAKPKPNRYKPRRYSDGCLRNFSTYNEATNTYVDEDGQLKWCMTP